MLEDGQGSETVLRANRPGEGETELEPQENQEGQEAAGG